jgi:outer membrane protein OmpA-like peptidoglycan-associated protein
LVNFKEVENMAKGNRKRSNKTPPKKVEEKKQVKKEEKPKTIYDMFPARTLNQDDANKMKEIFVLSNNLSALIKDYAETDITIKSMRELAKEIETDKEPVMLKVSKNLYKSKRDYKKVAKQIRDQANALEKSLTIKRGQIEHRYEDYVSSLIIHKRMVEGVIQSAKLKSITGHFSDEKTKKEEEILFEKDFDKITEEDKAKLKEINQAIKKKQKEEEKKIIEKIVNDKDIEIEMKAEKPKKKVK